MKEKEKTFREKWENEKSLNEKINKKKEEIEKKQFELERAETEYDLEKAAKIRHGILPKLQNELTELKKEGNTKILSDVVD